MNYIFTFTYMMLHTSTNKFIYADLLYTVWTRVQTCVTTWPFHLHRVIMPLHSVTADVLQVPLLPSSVSDSKSRLLPYVFKGGANSQA